MSGRQGHRDVSRSGLLEELVSTLWDAVVIGGGATGLGVALDAASRNLKVALIEKKDYGSGPTSTSTKLVHGGVRYLEKAIKELNYGQYQLVHEALHERKIMLNNAPHLARPQPFIIPVYSLPQKVYYFIGTKIYDFLAGRDLIPNARLLSLADTLKRFPMLSPQNLKGSILYYDGQFNDAFYATALMRTAIAYGACCLNYVEFIQADFQHNVHTIKVQDNLTGSTYEIRSKWILNCAGVHSDSIRKAIFPDLPPRLRPSKGAHIVLSKKDFPIDHALLIPSTEDGRVVFVIPWYYAVIVGTTDTEVQDPYIEPVVTEEDLDYLLRQVNPYLGRPIQKQDITASFAGYRPLVKANKARTEALIRNHEIEVFPQKHFLSVLGGKWTTYRKMAEEAVDRLIEHLGLPKVACRTQKIALVGATQQPAPNSTGLPEAIHQHLHYYGAEYPILLEYLNRWGTDLIAENYPFTRGEMFFLKEQAQIHTVHDALHRGTRLAIIDFKAANQARQTLQNLFTQIPTPSK